MNYTDAAIMRSSMGGQETNADATLDDFAERASRVIDHYCAKTSAADSINYFMLETKTETLTGQIDHLGKLVCWPHKPLIQSVSALAWRTDPRNTWNDVDPLSVAIQGAGVTCFDNLSYYRGLPIFVKVSYTGGMSTTLNGIDKAVMDAATVTAIRMYKEERSGMSDVVGVVELGTVQYVKAWPMSVIRNLQPFVRVVAWT